MRSSKSSSLEGYIPYFYLFVLCAYFCHRFYGVFFPFDADVPQHLYYRFNAPLIEADHNPFQWNYSAFMPYTGNHNPLILCLTFLTNSLGAQFSLAARSFFINCFTSFVSLWLLSCSLYWFFRYLGRRKDSSFLASIVVTFTGFHLVGVRQFDHLYQLSFIAVAPTLVCFSKICERKESFKWAVLAGLCIGISLLGGSNVPLFLYLPFCLALPWLKFRNDKNKKAAWTSTFWIATSLGIACLVASATLLPGLVYLGQTNRSGLLFWPESEISPTFFQKMISIFLRDWWVSERMPYYYIDYFLGLPVAILALSGLWEMKEAWKKKTPVAYLIQIMYVFLIAGIAVVNYSSLPRFIEGPISWFYSHLSIRYPHRFFLLCQIPLGLSVAYGLEAIVTRRTWMIGIASTALYAILFYDFVVPNWQNLLPDMKLAALLSQTFALLALLILFAKWKISAAKKSRLSATFSVVFILSAFGMYAFAPIQATSFGPSFYNQRDRIDRGWYPDRFSLRNLFALTANYGWTTQRVEALLTQPSPELTSPDYREGRIFEPMDPMAKSQSYFAPRVGLHFAFSNLRDPASSKDLVDLAKIANDDIFNLYNICWMGKTNADASGVIYERRPSCLADIFVVPALKRFSSESEVLEWMAKASTEDFQNFIAVDCSQFRCEGNPLTVPQLSSSTMTVLKRWPGQFIVDVQTDHPAFLFLSTLYRFDWKARVNDKRVTLFKADHAFMAVPLGAGKSHVELTLSHEIITAAETISVMSFLGFGTLWALLTSGKRTNRKRLRKR